MKYIVIVLTVRAKLSLDEAGSVSDISWRDKQVGVNPLVGILVLAMYLPRKWASLCKSHR